MAKTRAQRKAERRAREEQERKRSADGRADESQAQHDTQVPVSGDVAEVEAVEAGMAVGAPEQSLETPDAPRPSRAEKRAEAKRAKEAEKRRRAEQKRQERQQLSRQQKQATGRQRGGVLGFLISCWAELKKVQWPDRDTLVQATAVTILFVAVAGAYLGVLDTIFNYLVKQIL
jgi:preprotein translocase SecE subunit